ncbi:luc7-like protein 3 isoform X2 [Hyalella azteca]|uniref:Luc7-like protein 3 isoform X2 n=1 Tax=Hyalella azteca TaxID=294128 RepID=A0A979FHG1_HYAAZ|nr:luc7-like protein 3 isoform X2 [Hyalella azteca]
MAVSAAAALLDELMGRNRNVNPNDCNNKLTWESPEVCKHYLVKFCPHDLFTNTKSDLGICDKIHDEDIKREFDASNTHRRAAFEDDFIRYADTMLVDVDKRIRKGRQRLSLSVKEALSNVTTGDVAVDEQIELLSERITGLVNEAERLGNEGNVEEAQGLSKLCDKLREERDQLRKAHENTVWHQAAEMAASQEKQMEVCEICGAFLIVGDAQQRIDDHLTGKQHMGFAKLRDAIKEIKDAREKAREEREKQREKEREERRRLLDEEDKRRMGGARDDKPRDVRPPRDDRRDRDAVRRDDRRSDRDRDRDRSHRDRRSDRPDRGDRDRSSRDSRDRSSRDRSSRDGTSRDRSSRDGRRYRDDGYYGSRNGSGR